MSLQISNDDYIRIAGWIVTFILGAISAGIIVPQLTKERKVIAWAIISENELIPAELSKTLGMNIILQVGEYNPKSLSSIKLRFANVGNKVIQRIPIAVLFDEETYILKTRLVGNIGHEYRKGIQHRSENNEAYIDIAFINSGQSFDIELILSNYETGVVDVDAAIPELKIKRKSPTILDAEISNPFISNPFLRGIGINILGFRIDPTAIAINEVTEELRNIRKEMKK